MKEREIFVKAITQISARAAGNDTNRRASTVNQRKEIEPLVTAILRGKVSYGTPIEVGS